MSRLLAQPIHRDSVINGKFLAGILVISIMVFSLGIVVGAIGILMIGIPPTLEEIFRLLSFFVVTIFYMSIWLAISQLFSLLFKQSANICSCQYSDVAVPINICGFVGWRCS